MLLRRAPNRYPPGFGKGAVAFGLITSLLVSCVTAPGPEGVVLRYARSLEQGNLQDAYAQLTVSERERTSFADFKARYQDGGLRRSRALALRASVGELSAQTPAVALEREAGRWRILEPPSRADPRDALSRFLDAAEHRDFDGAYLLLAASWRARYTPQQLAADFASDPGADARLQRARLALRAPPKVDGDTAEYAVGDGKAVRLVRESDGYKVAALE